MMNMVLRNGFPIPSPRNVSDDEFDALVYEAEQRSVVVQGVRCVRFVGGRLLLEFHGVQDVIGAQGQTGWLNADERSLSATLRPRDGVHPAVVVGGVAYGDYELAQ